MKKKQRKKIYVQWEDHYGEQKGWIRENDLPAKGCPIVETIGFFIKETPGFIVISHSVGLDDDEFFDAFYIVKKAIIRRKWIK